MIFHCINQFPRSRYGRLKLRGLMFGNEWGERGTLRKLGNESTKEGNDLYWPSVYCYKNHKTRVL